MKRQHIFLKTKKLYVLFINHSVEWHPSLLTHRNNISIINALYFFVFSHLFSFLFFLSCISQCIRCSSYSQNGKYVQRNKWPPWSFGFCFGSQFDSCFFISFQNLITKKNHHENPNPKQKYNASIVSVC